MIDPRNPGVKMSVFTFVDEETKAQRNCDLTKILQPVENEV